MCKEYALKSQSIFFVTLLHACAKNKDLHRGSRVHADLLKWGQPKKSSSVAGALANMYARCGAHAKAHELLHALTVRDVFPWTSLIAGYIQHGQGHDALNCFEWMQGKGVSPDAVTFTCVLKACGSVGAVDKGEEFHDEIVTRGLLGNDVVLGTALVDMYAKCGALAKAQQVLEELSVRDAISWSALIAGYAQHGQGQDALNCFERMKQEGLSANAVTFACILKACGSIGAADTGECIHEEITRQGLLGKDIVLGNSLVEMYAKCGALAKAQCVLEELPVRNVVSWSALIAGYTQQGQGGKALRCFERMQHEGLSPDAVTFTCILKAFGNIGAAEKGERVHDEILKRGLLINNIVLGTALVDMYVKCDALTKAHQVLKELPVRDVFSWNALIVGYVQQGHSEDAWICFKEMQREGISPDVVTFTCILKACSNLGAANKGKQIHDEIVRQGLLEKNIVLGTALVDMYVKCGTLGKAQSVVEELPFGDAVAWTAIIAGYAQQGYGEKALKCFAQMQAKGLSPDSVTFSCVLNACCHTGLVHEGQIFFEEMNTKFGIKPDIEHYVCMVALLGQAGHLEKAVTLIQKMPPSDYSAVCSALLGFCRKWGDVVVGRWAFEHAIQLDRSDASPYVCMANIYADAGMHEDVEVVETLRVKNKAWKKREGN